MTEKKQRIEIGDWVRGKSKNGELIRGFVASADWIEGWVKVTVVACDNEYTVGKTVETLAKWVEKLQDSPRDEDQFLQLVDLALLTRDEPWFHELTTQLNQLRKGRLQNRKKFKWNPALNRLRRLGIGD